MISFISSFEIINAVIPDQSITSWVVASVAVAAAANSNGIKTLLARSLSTFFINENPLDWPILCNWDFIILY